MGHAAIKNDETATLVKSMRKVLSCKYNRRGKRKMRKKKKQRKKKNVLNRILGFLLALMLLAAGAFLAYRFIEISDGDISIRFPDIGGASEKDFAVYYVDVGQGDAAVVVCDGKTLVIDGGTDEGGDALCSYMRNTLKTEQVDFMIATHPHADHIGGLSDVLREYTVKKLYSSVDVYDSRTFERMAQYAAAQNLGITVAQAGQSFSLGRAKVEFLAPLGIYDDINDISLVAKVTFGETAFLFTGDAERLSEQDMVDSGEDLSATVLKVGHHGSNTSSSYVFLREVMPRYAVISCGTDNSYGHPHEEVLSRLRDINATVYRTDKNGTVVCRSDGKKVTFAVEKGSKPIETPRPELKGGYIGNMKSKKFHSPDCTSVQDMDARNRIVFASRAEAIRQGYTPCGNCKP